MADVGAYIQSIKSVAPYWNPDNQPTVQADLARRAANNEDVNFVTNEYTKPGGYGGLDISASDAATSQYKPSFDNSINALDLQGNALDQDKNDINNQYDTLGQTLTDNATAAQKGFEERQNQLGLLQSGNTGLGIGKIGSDLVKSQNQSAQERASQLANLALQRAGLGNQRASLTTTYNQNVNDAANKLMQGTQDALGQRKTDLFNRLTAIPQIYNQLFTGTAPLPPELYNKIIQGLSGALS